MFNAASSLSAETLAIVSTNKGLTTASSQQAGSVLNVGHLTGSTTSGNVLVGSAVNNIGTLDALVVTGGDLRVTNGSTLKIGSSNAAIGAIASEVTANNITLASKSVTIAGDVVTAGTLDFTINGTIQRTSGRFVVGTLTGSAQTLADFGTASVITNLGSISVVGSQLAIDNSVPITVSGPLSLEYFRISAATQITLSGDITTTGITAAGQGLSGNLSLINPTALAGALPATGSYFQVTDAGSGATFTQIGTVNLVPLNGTIATLRIQLPQSGGSIVLNDLNAPSADLVLFTQGGTARGTVNAAALILVGRSGAAEFNGLIDGLGGAAAASKAQIGPEPNATYRFNSCPIGSVNCVLAPISTVPPTNPLRNISIGAVRSVQDDSDLTLPNVSDEDY